MEKGKMPKISVVMPVYNTKEEYLREAIESILNQTYSDFEFIILNDGSTNNAEDVILSYKDERIKYFKNEENLGLPRTRNKLLDLAEGEYIAYMDSDDISVPNRFEKQVRYMDENKDVDILGAYIKLSPHNVICAKPAKPKFLDILKYCCMANNLIMMRRNKIQQYNLRYASDYLIAEDYDFWSRAIKYLKFANLEDVLCEYRVHKTNISKVKEDFLSAYDKKIRQNMLDFLTNDEKLQEIILKYLADEKAPTFFENIFSIRRSATNKQYKIITVLGFRFLTKSEKNNKCIIRIIGGLGNQMFQYAFAKAYSLKNKVDVLIDKSFYKENNKNQTSAPRTYDLNHFNIDESIATEEDNNKINQTIQEENACVYDKKLLCPPPPKKYSS